MVNRTMALNIFKPISEAELVTTTFPRNGKLLHLSLSRQHCQQSGESSAHALLHLECLRSHFRSKRSKVIDPPLTSNTAFVWKRRERE